MSQTKKLTIYYWHFTS